MDAFKFYKNPDLECPRYVSGSVYEAAKPGELLTYTPPSETANVSFKTPTNNEISALKNIINRCLAHYPGLAYADFAGGGAKTLITFSSYLADGGIYPGSVTIIDGTNAYVDTYSDSILYKNGIAVGIVAYKEGLILSKETINSTASISKARRSDLNTYMTIVHAEKDELNHSNNPTSSPLSVEQSDSRVYKEKVNIQPANIIKPLAVDTIPELEKQTFITKIGLYNKNKELIGVATLANPLRKTENREFTFKIKLDI